MRIETMQPQDWTQVCEIYREGIASAHATFETQVPTWEVWDATHLVAPRLVARGEGSGILGWAVLRPYSARSVYAGVAEVTIYVGSRHRGVGVGRALLEALITASEAAGIWTLQAGIFPENASSIALHEKCGFRQVGMRERLGQLLGVWRDVVLLERRSTVVAVDDSSGS